MAECCSSRGSVPKWGLRCSSVAPGLLYSTRQPRRWSPARYFGLEMKQSHAQAITAWLADNPATKHGQHQYSSEAFGLEAQSINRQFRDYVDRFGFGFGIRPALTL